MARTVLDAGATTGKPLYSESSQRNNGASESISPDHTGQNKYYGQS